MILGHGTSKADLTIREVPVPANETNYWGRKGYVPPTPPPPSRACADYGPAVAGFECNSGYCVDSGNADQVCPRNPRRRWRRLLVVFVPQFHRHLPAGELWSQPGGAHTDLQPPERHKRLRDGVS